MQLIKLNNSNQCSRHLHPSSVLLHFLDNMLPWLDIQLDWVLLSTHPNTCESLLTHHITGTTMQHWPTATRHAAPAPPTTRRLQVAGPSVAFHSLCCCGPSSHRNSKYNKAPTASRTALLAITSHSSAYTTCRQSRRLPPANLRSPSGFVHASDDYTLNTVIEGLVSITVLKVQSIDLQPFSG